MPKLNKRLVCLYLDILSLPGIFMNKKNNAKFHLKYICPRCPKWKNKLREINKNQGCYWHYNWKKGNYNIQRNFGIKNFILQHVYLKTDLSNIKNAI